ncbi:MAG: MOSC domain-containing protein, partial [Limisphaerales bacterium]
ASVSRDGRPTKGSMAIQIGEVSALYRYPVKSMAGESLDVADVGWHGLAGDRRMAFRRIDDRGGFPWLTASRLPELVLHVPRRLGPSDRGELPTHVRTPDGRELAVFGHELAKAVGLRHGSAVEMIHLNRGIFDEASLSVVSRATINEVARLAAQPPDVRRFRPNILIASRRSAPFEEDEWVGGSLSFGAATDGAAIAITHCDERCSMVNLDPDSARPAPEMLKAIVGARDNKAGVYASVTRRGRVAVGQPVFFIPAAGQPARE